MVFKDKLNTNLTNKENKLSSSYSFWTAYSNAKSEIIAHLIVGVVVIQITMPKGSIISSQRVFIGGAVSEGGVPYFATVAASTSGLEYARMYINNALQTPTVIYYYR